MPFCFSVSCSFDDVVACEFAFGVRFLSDVRVRFAFDCSVCVFVWGECNVLVDSIKKRSTLFYSSEG